MAEGRRPTEQDPKRTEYLEERKLLVEAEREAAQSFDKFMVTLSAGAFGLSIAFVRELVPSPRFLWLLHSAWGAFGLSLCFIVASFLISQSALRRQRDILDESYRDDEAARSERNLPAVITGVLNWLSIALFGCGVAALISFAMINYAP